MNAAYGKQFERIAKNILTTSAEFSATIAFAFVGGVAISGAPPVTPWAIPAFIGCINPAVNAPNIPCFKSPLLPIMPDKNPAA
jgi:hypothetical protein